MIKMKYGIIAGNGRFPVIALESARKQGDEAIALAIREEASPDVERAAAPLPLALSRRTEQIDRDLPRRRNHRDHDGRAGQTRKDLFLHPRRLATAQSAGDTGSQEHGFTDRRRIKVLADEGINLVDSTLLLKPLLAQAGAITKRKPDSDEKHDIEYGRKIAHALASLDLGQSVAIADRACVALEAMEGTDAMLRRAASLVEGKRLTLVKSSSRRRHLLFDVPVIGPLTIDVMIETNTTALAVDAGRTLLLDREELLQKANAAKVAIIAMEAP